MFYTTLEGKMQKPEFERLPLLTIFLNSLTDDARRRHQHHAAVHGVHLGEGHGRDGLVAARDQTLRRSVYLKNVHC